MKETKPLWFGAAYYPEDWPEEERPRDIEWMKKAGMNVMRVGEFAWSKMERRPGEYDFSWLHRVVDDLGKNGIRTILGTPTATPPRWFLKKYPDAARLESDGKRVPHGGRRHCCSNNPDYQAESAKIVRKMAEEFGSDPNVIGWQIDNEIYSSGDGCVCPVCEEKFHRYLEKKYGKIEALNAAWNLNLFSQEYDSFDEIPLPVRGWQNPHLRLEWATFRYASDMEFVRMQRDILKEYTSAPIGTDMMSVNGMAYEDMAEFLDVLQFNHYNTEADFPALSFWYDLMRPLKDQPFWNTETSTGWNGGADIGQVAKPVGFCRLNSWMPVALGGEANLYWLWRQHWAGHELVHGSVITPAARPIPMFDEVQTVSAEFEKAAEFIRATKVKTDVAFHFTSLSSRLFKTQPIVHGLKYDEWFASDLINRFYRPLTDLGLRPDVLGAKGDLSSYRVLVSPMVMSLEDGDLGDRIEQWVRDGGTWIVGPMTDIRNGIGAHFTDAETGRIERMTGATLLGSVPDSGKYVCSVKRDGTPFAADLWQEVYSVANGAESYATVTEGYPSLVGGTILQKCPCGKGTVWLLGTFPSAADWQELLKIACGEAGVSVPQTAGTVCAVPRKGTNREGLILAETAHAAASYMLDRPMTDLLTGKRYEGTVELKPYDLLILE